MLVIKVMRIPIILSVLALFLLVFEHVNAAEIGEKQNQDIWVNHNKCVSKGFLACTDQYSDCVSHPDKYIDSSTPKKYGDEFVDETGTKRNNKTFAEEEKAHKNFKKYNNDFAKGMKSTSSEAAEYERSKRNNKGKNNSFDITKTFPVK